jgi:3-deoxy-D-manno-octulosonate 8-phosphate phosphatase (KDO 8-P phosphatase)
MANLRKRAEPVKLLVLDVDGVLTDGGLYFGPNGEALKRFHVRDGAGIKAVSAAGIAVAVVSGRSFPGTIKRMAELGVTDVIQGVSNKVASVETLMTTDNLNWSEVAVICDDTTDLALMDQAGLAVAVADAHQDVVHLAHWCTAHDGGQGAVREVCDLLVSVRS